MNRRRFVLLSLAALALAFLVREWFVLTAVIPNPNQGDVGAYLRYALHLVWDGTFSQAGNGEAVVADAYRSPGYPLLLAGVFRVTGMDGWYPAIYQVQVVLGVATVAGVIVLARQWLSRGWAVAAGLWLALQPHHIAATGAILTEVLFGLCIVAGLLCAVLAGRARSMRLALLAGLAFGAGYLVNPVLGLFPFVACALLCWQRLPRQGVALLLVSLLAIGGWSARNAMVGASGDGRAVENFVQGATPGYHHAAHWFVWHPEERAVLDRMRAETQAMRQDRGAGLRMVGERLSADPARYARWYLFEKPYLLWDWDIRMGKGGVYQIYVADSPLDHGPLLLPVILQWAVNPLVFALALLGIVLGLRHPQARLVALFALYITAVHVVFQAEPRYAIPCRGVEIILACAGLARAWSWVGERARGGRVAGAPVRRDSLGDAELVDVSTVPVR